MATGIELCWGADVGGKCVNSTWHLGRFGNGTPLAARASDRTSTACRALAVSVTLPLSQWQLCAERPGRHRNLQCLLPYAQYPLLFRNASQAGNTEVGRVARNTRRTPTSNRFACSTAFILKAETRTTSLSRRLTLCDDGKIPRLEHVTIKRPAMRL